MPTLLLTGATGVLGRYALPALLSAGYSVRVLARSPLPEGVVPPEHATRVTVFEGELHDPTVLRQASSGIEAAVHMAGLVSFASGDKERLMHVNKEGTAAVVNALLEVAPSAHLVHISSVAAYPTDRSNEQLVTEPAHFGGWYGFSKHQAELEVQRAAAEGLRFTILRPSVILGRHPDHRSSASLIEMALRRFAIVPPGYLNFIAVQDVVEAILAVLRRGPSDQTYTLDAGPVRWEDFFLGLRSAAGITRRPFILPDSAWPAFSRLIPLAGLFYSGPPPIRRQVLRLLNRNTYPGRPDAESLIGHTLTPLPAILPSLVLE